MITDAGNLVKYLSKLKFFAVFIINALHRYNYKMKFHYIFEGSLKTAAQVCFHSSNICFLSIS